jgi:23S rRNA pseudouridine2605 synthase
MEERRKPRSFKHETKYEEHETEAKRRETGDRRRAKPENRNVGVTPGRQKTNSADRRERPADRRERPADRRERPADRRERPADRRERPTDRRERPVDRRERPADRRERPADRRERPIERENQFSEFRPRKRDVTAESKILSEIVETRRREGRPSPKRQKILTLEHEEKFGPIRLNKYISNSGICSRRDADMLIQTGAIQVNGQIVTELGTKVMPTDEVRFGDRILQREKPVYLLLNKPKDYITTMEDERDRKHVMELVKGACKERIYPVGRLDKNSTGLLLFTNDGEMTKKLTHPKHGIRKIYYVELNKNLTIADFEKIANGIELSDGEIKVDEIAFAGETKREIGITLHSGKNRIVRRIFEHLGYEVVKLDRVVFAGLTKKDLPRGKYRFLSEAEINILKMTN